ncbi:helix-turn-helix transcriptional regulator [Streptomyces sp. S1]|uniref:helix-turn-helix domain-containing protein n=1 Tax=Streptomyces sp. S1 TaxID=718288 RepID=UPI000EF75C22|nr:helix-turn-helix transcriptional regulator [Streptomyces sp. S1]
MARAENKETAGPMARMVATVVKRMRVKEGLTQEQLGSRMGYTGAAISALETLSQPVSDDMMMQLETVLGGGTGIFAEMRPLVRLEKLPEEFRDYAQIEQKALSLCLYASSSIHGLFQTEPYARAQIAGGYPTPTEARVEELVTARMERKAIFDKKPLRLVEVILDEAALLRKFGSEEVMREQYRYLLECAQRKNVTIQILPLDVGLSGENAGDRGMMNLVETDKHNRLIYLEIQDESVLITDPVKVSTYAQRYAKIRAQALDPRASLGLIKRLAGEGT